MNWENYFWIGIVGAVLAIAFAYVQSRKVMTFSEGTDTMKKIAASIREGANAYLRRQYTTVAKVFVVVFVVLLVIAFATNGEMLSKFTPFAFVTGGIWSMLAGFVGMKIATSSNARTAQAASESLNKGLRVAFSSGSVMGFTVVGLGMLDITIWYFLLHFVFGITDATTLANIMVMNGMGASFMALFARVGGGIYTKAADVGADLVGKVEAGIPEDDPRNPATIADNVGDNVGDVAGMGADLYESYVGSILATFALSAVAGYGFGGMLLPMLLAVEGIICSIIGSFFVRTKEDADQKSLLKSLRTGTYLSAVLAAVIAAPITYLVLGNWGIYVAILAGLIGGCAIGYFTEYYTSDTYKPTQKLAASSDTGSATGNGFAIGSASLTALALLVSYVDIVQSKTSEVVISAFTMSAVQTAAQSIVVEVRRQFREIAGIMEGKADPDYASCVALCTKGALHEMVAPALLAIVVPILTGLILGPTGVVGLLGGVSVTGFAMAVFMSNAGGAWDNAKKYIESGHHGGKGSDCHKAAVVGDTVGDPFKDTSGPSLNILIKLCSTVSIVFSGLIVAFNLMNIL